MFLAFAAAGVMMALGALHLLYALRDFLSEPRYFSPRDKAILAAMRQTRTGIAPHGRDYWSGVLGFNLSQSDGVMLFALLIVVATVYRIDWLKPPLIGVGLVYAMISYRCWFATPTIGVSIATLLLIIGWGASLPIW